MNELPKLTSKQQAFVMKYAIDGNGVEAYRFAYDCQGSNEATISSEVNKLLKNPKITLWLERMEANKQKVVQEEFNYTVKDAFDELIDLQSRCRKSSKTYNVEKSCIDTKCKLAGLLVDRQLNATGTLADVLDQLK